MVGKDVGDVQRRVGRVDAGQGSIRRCKDGMIALLEGTDQCGGSRAEDTGEQGEAGAVEGSGETCCVIGVLGSYESDLQDDGEECASGELHG